MGAKCKYTVKYKPLVDAKASEFLGQPDAFDKWLEDHFTNWQQAKTFSDATGLKNNFDVVERTIGKSPERIDSIKAFYANNSIAYNKCIHSFEREIVESSLFNGRVGDGGTWIDANEKSNEYPDFDNLNANLFKYKLRLINKILGPNSINFSMDDPNANDLLVAAINKALETYDKRQNDILADPETSDAYEAYVILKNFNKLINERTPFIKLKKEYKDTDSHGVNMYVFNGPTVKHRVRHSVSEHISAESQYSDLAKILLEYLPKANFDGNGIPDTSIGVQGFVSVMNRFKTALFYTSDMEKYRTQFYRGQFPNGVSAWLEEALDAYYTILRNSSLRLKGSVTTQLDTLKGISKFIFGGSLSEDVKEMFAGMFLKTDPLFYVAYRYNHGTIQAVDLVDKYVNTEMLNLEEMINGRIETFIKNKKLFEDLLTSSHNIEVVPSNDGSTWTISFNDGAFKIIWNKTISREGKFIQYSTILDGAVDKSGDEIFVKLISDVLGADLPIGPEYSRICTAIYGENKNSYILEHFAPVIAAVLITAWTKSKYNNGLVKSTFEPWNNVKEEIDFNTHYLYALLEEASTALAYIEGTESRNVVDDVNGNKLPTNGLTSLIMNAHTMMAEMTWDDSDPTTPVDRQDTTHKSIYRHSIVAPKWDEDKKTYSTPGFLQPIIRQGVRIRGKSKKIADLTLDELLEIAISYDFLDSLDSGNTVRLQNANVADKERHWIIEYMLKNVQLPDGEGGVVNYDMLQLIKSAAKGSISAQKELENVWRIARQLRYNAVASNIIADYNTIFQGKTIGGRKIEEFKTLADIDLFLSKTNWTPEILTAIFRKNSDYLIRAGFSEEEVTMLTSHSKRINCKEEIHYSKVGEHVRMNETLMHLQTTFNDPKIAEGRLKKSRAFFAKDLFKSHVRLNKNQNDVIKKLWDGKGDSLTIDDSWKEKRGKLFTGNLILFKVYDERGNLIDINSGNIDKITDARYTVILNPLLEAYMMSDIIYSNDFNSLLTGDVFGHPTKDLKGDPTINNWGTSEYYDRAEASRLVAMNKRAVIYGASIHAFQHHLANNRGTAEDIKTAVISDPEVSVWTLMGGLENDAVDDPHKVYDGSGLQSPYQAIFEQESLKDAAVGYDEKTILGYNDKYYGGQKLFKWAVYGITNERRRLSRGSKISLDYLFEKMHQIAFDKRLNMKDVWNNRVGRDWYFKDYNTGKYYKIVDVVEVVDSNTGDTAYVRSAVEVTKDGKPIESAPTVYLDNRNNIEDLSGIEDLSEIVFNENNRNRFLYNTIYYLDQFFGGCDEMSLIDGTLVHTSDGNNIVSDIICDEDLKSHFISYVVNKSAVKSGAENINSDTAYWDTSELDYMIMSTKYGGLQMNAEHELDDSEVTEMTQMISALIEKGWNQDLVNAIYTDIGEVVLESLQKFKSAIKSYDSDPEKLKRVFGQALIEAYAKGDRDTLGLAQAFLAKAERLLKEKNIKFQFPFSGATIQGSFVSTVAALLTKKGIRRKYAGVAAVLTPSHNIITTFGNGKMFDAYARELIEWRARPENQEYSNLTVDELIHNIEVVNIRGERVLNPFIVRDLDKTFDFEDTIVITENVVDENGAPVFNADGSPLYEWKDVVIDSFEKYEYYKHYYSGPVYKFTSRPKNLKGSNTYYIFDGKKYSVCDWTTVRAANRSIKKTWDFEDKQLIFSALEFGISTYSERVVYFKDLNNTDIAAVRAAIASRSIEELEKRINIRKTLYNIIQNQMHDLTDHNIVYRYVKIDGNPSFVKTKVTGVEVTSAEIVLGKMWAKQFGLKAGDDIGEILEQGSRFFKNRLSTTYVLPENLSSDHYDAIVWTKDRKPLLVKIDPNLEYNFNKSVNTDITDVDGTLYLDEKELCNSDEKQVFKLHTDSDEYDVIVLRSAKDFQGFIDDVDSDFYRINEQINPDIVLDMLSTDDTYIWYDNDGEKEIKTEITKEDLLTRIEDQGVKSVIDHVINSHLIDQIYKWSEKMFDSFKLSLNAVGARIPSQSMQSFQPMKIVGFTDSETNDVYVNRFNTYLEGSDYDIDKSYIITYEINQNGLVDTGSRLADWKQIGVSKSLELLLPKGRTFEEGSDGQLVSINDVQKALKGDVLMINKILSGETVLSFKRFDVNTNAWIDLIDPKDIKLTERLIKMLNTHEHSRVTEAALKNRVVHGIRKVVLNPKNQLNLQNPISMDTQKEAASHSELSKDEQHINTDIPSSKYMMQVQNMTGKQCIGITAVAIKSFFAKSSYINSLLELIPDLAIQGRQSEINDILKSITYIHPITGETTLLANVNLKDIIDKIPEEQTQLRLRQTLMDLERRCNRVDCALELSGLLSAATDNAKELILNKINATTKLIDLYTIALQSGTSFDEISSIMMNPLVNAVSRLASNNIFKHWQGSYNIEKAISFYLDEGFLPNVKKSELLREVKTLINNPDFTEENLLGWLKNNDNVIRILEVIDRNVEKQSNNAINDDGYEDNEFEGTLPSRSDWLGIQDFLEQCLDRNNTHSELRKNKNYEKWISDLNKIKKRLIPAAEEQNILGAMLKINQGLPNSAYEQYAYIQRITNFITKRIGEQFDLMEFINNEEYAIDMIQKYESQKSTINILSVIKGVPHFNEMFNSLYDNNFILTHLSARYEITATIAKQINPGYQVSEQEFKAIGNYVNDLMLASWLTSKDLEITVPRDFEYYDEINGEVPILARKDTSIKLDSLFGLATFKNWMENYMIPMLKNQYSDNYFLFKLSRASSTDRMSGEKRSYYKLPLNMMAIDSTTENKEKYEKLLDAFNAIANDRVEGWKIADLFFVYNAIVNKDSFGHSSLTRFFEDLINDPKSSTLVKEYYEFISNVDENNTLREQFLNNVDKTDAAFYIKQRVKYSKISSNPSLLNQFGKDFTFRFPSLLSKSIQKKPNVKPFVATATKYQYEISSLSTVNTVASALSTKYHGAFELHTDEWVSKNFPNASGERAFISTRYNKETQSWETKVIINQDFAIKGGMFDVLHEYAHLIFAAMKYNPKSRELYFKLVNSVKNHPTYEKYKEDYSKIGLTGSDLNEEVFVKIMEDYFKNRVTGSSVDGIFESNKYPIIDALNEVFETNVPYDVDLLDLMASDPRDIIKIFGSRLFNLDQDYDLSEQAITWRLQTSTLKQELIKEKMISEKC